jgi:tripartite-type tricarboxylate transporter receptor subunit TctC
MTYLKGSVIILATLFFTFMACVGWTAENYPTRTVQIIVPQAAGGSIDLTTRLIADKLRGHLEQPVIVENRPGAGAAMGTSFVATSKPDGYTILSAAGGGSFECLPIMNPGISYKVSDFVPIASLVKFTQVAIANMGLPVKDFAELISYAQKNPGTLSYGSVGIGSYAHLLIELLKANRNMQLDIQHIPYNGGAPALTAVVGNHTPVAILPLGTVTKHIAAKSIRALTVFSPKRSPFLPDVSTTTEQGFPELIADSYFVYYAPAKTPPTIVKKLESALEKIIQDKVLVEKFAKLDLTVDFKNSLETQEFLNNSVKKLEPVIRKANIYIK